MRVFYFSPESGVYQGEGFLDERDLESVEALTPIAPPRYAKGEVPVFNATTQSWMLLKVPRKPHLSQ